MPFVLEASQVSPTDRAEYIRDAIWRSVVRVDIEHQGVAADIAATCALSAFGRMTICSVRSNATTIRRTPKFARDDLEPSLFLGMQVSGTSMVIQDDRQAVLGPGDMALYDTTRPYTLINDAGIDHHYFRIPRGDLALPGDALRRITATTLHADSPVTDLAATYFARLATQLTDSSRARVEALGTPSIELVRALIATELDEPQLATEPLQATLEFRILEYVQAHLAEHDLSAARIAAKHNVSVRHLYAVLARSGISLGEWVRAHRLEECRKDLSQSGATSMTIAAVARKWGFPNATHFGRVFRDAYGMSPREWRAMKQAQADVARLDARPR